MSAPTDAETDEMAKAWADLLTSDMQPREFADAVDARLVRDRGRLSVGELSCLRDLAVLRLSRPAAVASCGVRPAATPRESWPVMSTAAPPAVDPKHLVPDGPPHPDPETERAILRWAHGYRENEPDPWSKREFMDANGIGPEEMVNDLEWPRE